MSKQSVRDVTLTVQLHIQRLFISLFHWMISDLLGHDIKRLTYFSVNQFALSDF